MTRRSIPVLPGTIFGYLLILEDIGSRRDGNGISRRWVRCRCSCGAVTEHRLAQIRFGGAKSCGCLRVRKMIRHGKSGSSTFRTWIDMRQRCSNHSHSRYKDYGGRGIQVCKRWSLFENFLSDMGERPSDDLSIDRIDNDGDYEANNCRWATRSEQQQNKRRHPHVDA